MIATQGIQARPGVLRLFEEGEREKILMAVATTTSAANVAALFPGLFGLAWRDRFATIICAEDAPRKKPDPMAFQLVLQSLGVSASEVLAIEDSANGLNAARAAGIAVLVTPSVYFAQEAMTGAAAVCADLDQPLSLGSIRFPCCNIEALQTLLLKENAHGFARKQ